MGGLNEIYKMNKNKGVHNPLKLNLQYNTSHSRQRSLQMS